MNLLSPFLCKILCKVSYCVSYCEVKNKMRNCTMFGPSYCTCWHTVLSKTPMKSLEHITYSTLILALELCSSKHTHSRADSSINLQTLHSEIVLYFSQIMKRSPFSLTFSPYFFLPLSSFILQFFYSSSYFSLISNSLEVCLHLVPPLYCFFILPELFFHLLCPG